MIVGIDGVNVRAGGGLTYLMNFLGAAAPREHGIEKIVVWGGRRTLDPLPERPWLERVHHPWLDRSMPYRVLWQRYALPRAAAATCDLLWVPGGFAARGFRPIVAMSRNMLPFEWREAARYGASYTTLRLVLLRWGLAHTFRVVDGLIFVTRYGHDAVLAKVRVRGRITIIPHGVEERFRAAPRPQRPIEACSAADPFRLLYVSIVDVYKHQDHVAEAVALLRARGLPVALELAGPAYPPSLRKLERVLDRADPARSFLRYLGPVPFERLHALHASADAFVFASSCENMPNILLEAMAGGLPIACAARGPMPEILGEAGVFFDPENPEDIAGALTRLIEDPAQRARKAQEAYARALRYSWERCTRETLAFLASTARERPRGRSPLRRPAAVL